jgi:ribonuclease J
MKICIHRGANQIGGSCVELESRGSRLLLDLGLPLDAEENSSSYLPTLSGLREADETLLGVLISHPHLDHYGLLAHVRSDLPVAMGAAARRIVEAAAPWVPGSLTLPEGPILENRRRFDWGPFQITPFLVDHSAFDAYAFLIEADGQRVFYSGDFRAHGRKGKLFEKMIAWPPKGIDVLLMEGSSLGRLDIGTTFETESDLEDRMFEEIRATEGMALVYASAQNIDRIVTIFRAAKRSGRTMVIDLYTASILEATGKDSIPKSHWPEVCLYVPHRQRIQIKENARFDTLARHSANRIFLENLVSNPKGHVMLFRPAHMRDLEQAEATKGARFLYSMWEGYLKNDHGSKVQYWANRMGIPFAQFHTSGHAGPSDLKRYADALDPKVIVPIHSFHPAGYVQLFPRVEHHNDGVWWDLSPASTPKSWGSRDILGFDRHFSRS